MGNYLSKESDPESDDEKQRKSPSAQLSPQRAKRKAGTDVKRKILPPPKEKTEQDVIDEVLQEINLEEQRFKSLTTDARELQGSRRKRLVRIETMSDEVKKYKRTVRDKVYSPSDDDTLTDAIKYALVSEVKGLNSKELLAKESSNRPGINDDVLAFDDLRDINNDGGLFSTVKGRAVLPETCKLKPRRPSSEMRRNSFQVLMEDCAGELVWTGIFEEETRGESESLVDSEGRVSSQDNDSGVGRSNLDLVDDVSMVSSSPSDFFESSHESCQPHTERSKILGQNPNPYRIVSPSNDSFSFPQMSTEYPKTQGMESTSQRAISAGDAVLIKEESEDGHIKPSLAVETKATGIWKGQGGDVETESYVIVPCPMTTEPFVEIDPRHLEGAIPHGKLEQTTRIDGPPSPRSKIPRWDHAPKSGNSSTSPKSKSPDGGSPQSGSSKEKRKTFHKRDRKDRGSLSGSETTSPLMSPPLSPTGLQAQPPRPGIPISTYFSPSSSDSEDSSTTQLPTPKPVALRNKEGELSFNPLQPIERPKSKEKMSKESKQKIKVGTGFQPLYVSTEALNTGLAKSHSAESLLKMTERIQPAFDVSTLKTKDGANYFAQPRSEDRASKDEAQTIPLASPPALLPSTPFQLIKPKKQNHSEVKANGNNDFDFANIVPHASQPLKLLHFKKPTRMKNIRGFGSTGGLNIDNEGTENINPFHGRVSKTRLKKLKSFGSSGTLDNPSKSTEDLSSKVQMEVPKFRSYSSMGRLDRESDFFAEERDGIIKKLDPSKQIFEETPLDTVPPGFDDTNAAKSITPEERYFYEKQQKTGLKLQNIVQEMTDAMQETYNELGSQAPSSARDKALEIAQIPYDPQTTVSLTFGAKEPEEVDMKGKREFFEKVGVISMKGIAKMPPPPPPRKNKVKEEQVKEDDTSALVTVQPTSEKEDMRNFKEPPSQRIKPASSPTYMKTKQEIISTHHEEPMDPYQVTFDTTISDAVMDEYLDIGDDEISEIDKIIRDLAQMSEDRHDDDQRKKIIEVMIPSLQVTYIESVPGYMVIHGKVIKEIGDDSSTYGVSQQIQSSSHESLIPEELITEGLVSFEEGSYQDRAEQVHVSVKSKAGKFEDPEKEFVPKRKVKKDRKFFKKAEFWKKYDRGETKDKRKFQSDSSEEEIGGNSPSGSEDDSLPHGSKSSKQRGVVVRINTAKLKERIEGPRLIPHTSHEGCIQQNNDDQQVIIGSHKYEEEAEFNINVQLASRKHETVRVRAGFEPGEEEEVHSDDESKEAAYWKLVKEGSETVLREIEGGFQEINIDRELTDGPKKPIAVQLQFGVPNKRESKEDSPSRVHSVTVVQKNRLKSEELEPIKVKRAASDKQQLSLNDREYWQTTKTDGQTVLRQLQLHEGQHQETQSDFLHDEKQKTVECLQKEIQVTTTADSKYTQYESSQISSIAVQSEKVTSCTTETQSELTSENLKLIQPVADSRIQCDIVNLGDLARLKALANSVDQETQSEAKSLHDISSQTLLEERVAVSESFTQSETVDNSTDAETQYELSGVNHVGIQSIKLSTSDTGIQFEIEAGDVFHKSVQYSVESVSQFTQASKADSSEIGSQAESQHLTDSSTQSEVASQMSRETQSDVSVRVTQATQIDTLDEREYSTACTQFEHLFSEEQSIQANPVTTSEIFTQSEIKSYANSHSQSEVVELQNTECQSDLTDLQNAETQYDRNLTTSRSVQSDVKETKLASTQSEHQDLVETGCQSDAEIVKSQETQVEFSYQNDACTQSEADYDTPMKEENTEFTDSYDAETQFEIVGIDNKGVQSDERIYTSTWTQSDKTLLTEGFTQYESINVLNAETQMEKQVTHEASVQSESQSHETKETQYDRAEMVYKEVQSESFPLVSTSVQSEKYSQEDAVIQVSVRVPSSEKECQHDLESSTKGTQYESEEVKAPLQDSFCQYDITGETVHTQCDAAVVINAHTQVEAQVSYKEVESQYEYSLSVKATQCDDVEKKVELHDTSSQYDVAREEVYTQCEKVELRSVNLQAESLMSFTETASQYQYETSVKEVQCGFEDKKPVVRSAYSQYDIKGEHAQTQSDIQSTNQETQSETMQTQEPESQYQPCKADIGTIENEHKGTQSETTEFSNQASQYDNIKTGHQAVQVLPENADKETQWEKLQSEKDSNKELKKLTLKFDSNGIHWKKKRDGLGGRGNWVYDDLKVIVPKDVEASKYLTPLADVLSTSEDHIVRVKRADTDTSDEEMGNVRNRNRKKSISDCKTEKEENIENADALKNSKQAKVKECETKETKKRLVLKKKGMMPEKDPSNNMALKNSQRIERPSENNVTDVENLNVKDPEESVQSSDANRNDKVKKTSEDQDNILEEEDKKRPAGTEDENFIEPQQHKTYQEDKIPINSSSMTTEMRKERRRSSTHIDNEASKVKVTKAVEDEKIQTDDSSIPNESSKKRERSPATVEKEAKQPRAEEPLKEEETLTDDTIIPSKTRQTTQRSSPPVKEEASEPLQDRKTSTDDSSMPSEGRQGRRRSTASVEEEASKPETEKPLKEEKTTTDDSNIPSEMRQRRQRSKAPVEEEASKPETEKPLKEEKTTTDDSNIPSEVRQGRQRSTASIEEEASKPETEKPLKEEKTTTDDSNIPSEMRQRRQRSKAPVEEEASKPETEKPLKEEKTTTDDSNIPSEMRQRRKRSKAPVEEEASKPETEKPLKEEKTTTDDSNIPSEMRQRRQRSKAPVEEEASKPETEKPLKEEKTTTDDSNIPSEMRQRRQKSKASIEEEASKPETEKPLKEEKTTTDDSNIPSEVRQGRQRSTASVEEEASKPETEKPLKEEKTTTDDSNIPSEVRQGRQRSTASVEEEASKPETEKPLKEEKTTTDDSNIPSEMRQRRQKSKASIEEEASKPETEKPLKEEKTTTDDSNIPSEVRQGRQRSTASVEEEASKPDTEKPLKEEKTTTDDSNIPSEMRQGKQRSKAPVKEEASKPEAATMLDEKQKPSDDSSMLPEASKGRQRSSAPVTEEVSEPLEDEKTATDESNMLSRTRQRRQRSTAPVEEEPSKPEAATVLGGEQIPRDDSSMPPETTKGRQRLSASAEEKASILLQDEKTPTDNPSMSSETRQGKQRSTAPVEGEAIKAEAATMLEEEQKPSDDSSMPSTDDSSMLSEKKQGTQNLSTFIKEENLEATKALDASANPLQEIVHFVPSKQNLLSLNQRKRKVSGVKGRGNWVVDDVNFMSSNNDKGNEDFELKDIIEAKEANERLTEDIPLPINSYEAARDSDEEQSEGKKRNPNIKRSKDPASQVIKRILGSEKEITDEKLGQVTDGDLVAPDYRSEETASKDDAKNQSPKEGNKPGQSEAIPCAQVASKTPAGERKLEDKKAATSNEDMTKGTENVKPSPKKMSLIEQQKLRLQNAGGRVRRKVNDAKHQPEASPSQESKISQEAEADNSATNKTHSNTDMEKQGREKRLKEYTLVEKKEVEEEPLLSQKSETMQGTVPEQNPRDDAADSKLNTEKKERKRRSKDQSPQEEDPSKMLSAPNSKDKTLQEDLTEQTSTITTADSKSVKGWEGRPRQSKEQAPVEEAPVQKLPSSSWDDKTLQDDLTEQTSTVPTADSKSVKDRESRPRQSKDQAPVQEAPVQKLPSPSRDDKTLQDDLTEQTSTVPTADSKSVKDRESRPRQFKDQAPVEEAPVQKLPSPSRDDKTLQEDVTEQTSTATFEFISPKDGEGRPRRSKEQAPVEEAPVQKLPSPSRDDKTLQDDLTEQTSTVPTADSKSVKDRESRPRQSKDQAPVEEAPVQKLPSPSRDDKTLQEDVTEQTSTATSEFISPKDGEGRPRRSKEQAPVEEAPVQKLPSPSPDDKTLQDDLTEQTSTVPTADSKSVKDRARRSKEQAPVEEAPVQKLPSSSWDDKTLQDDLTEQTSTVPTTDPKSVKGWEGRPRRSKEQAPVEEAPVQKLPSPSWDDKTLQDDLTEQTSTVPTADSKSVKDRESRPRQSKDQAPVEEAPVQKLPSPSRDDKTLQEDVTKQTSTVPTADSKSVKDRESRPRQSKDQAPVQEAPVQKLPSPSRDDKTLQDDLTEQTSTVPTADSKSVKDRESRPRRSKEQAPVEEAPVQKLPSPSRDDKTLQDDLTEQTLAATTADFKSPKDGEGRQRRSKDQSLLEEAPQQKFSSTSQDDKTLQKDLTEQTSVATTADPKSVKGWEGKQRRSKEQAPMEEAPIQESPSPCQKNKTLQGDVSEQTSTVTTADEKLVKNENAQNTRCIERKVEEMQSDETQFSPPEKDEAFKGAFSEQSTTKTVADNNISPRKQQSRREGSKEQTAHKLITMAQDASPEKGITSQEGLDKMDAMNISADKEPSKQMKGRERRSKEKAPTDEMKTKQLTTPPHEIEPLQGLETEGMSSATVTRNHTDEANKAGQVGQVLHEQGTLIGPQDTIQDVKQLHEAMSSSVKPQADGDKKAEDIGSSKKRAIMGHDAQDLRPTDSKALIPPPKVHQAAKDDEKLGQVTDGDLVAPDYRSEETASKDDAKNQSPKEGNKPGQSEAIPCAQDASKTPAGERKLEDKKAATSNEDMTKGTENVKPSPKKMSLIEQQKLRLQNAGDRRRRKVSGLKGRGNWVFDDVNVARKSFEGEECVELRDSIENNLMDTNSEPAKELPITEYRVQDGEDSDNDGTIGKVRKPASQVSQQEEKAAPAVKGLKDREFLAEKPSNAEKKDKSRAALSSKGVGEEEVAQHDQTISLEDKTEKEEYIPQRELLSQQSVLDKIETKESLVEVHRTAAQPKQLREEKHFASVTTPFPSSTDKAEAVGKYEQGQSNIPQAEPVKKRKDRERGAKEQIAEASQVAKEHTAPCSGTKPTKEDSSEQATTIAEESKKWLGRERQSNEQTSAEKTIKNEGIASTQETITTQETANENITADTACDNKPSKMREGREKRSKDQTSTEQLSNEAPVASPTEEITSSQVLDKETTIDTGTENKLSKAQQDKKRQSIKETLIGDPITTVRDTPSQPTTPTGERKLEDKKAATSNEDMTKGTENVKPSPKKMSLIEQQKLRLQNAGGRGRRKVNDAKHQPEASPSQESKISQEAEADNSAALKTDSKAFEEEDSTEMQLEDKKRMEENIVEKESFLSEVGNTLHATVPEQTPIAADSTLVKDRIGSERGTKEKTPVEEAPVQKFHSSSQEEIALQESVIEQTSTATLFDPKSVKVKERRERRSKEETPVEETLVQRSPSPSQEDRTLQKEKTEQTLTATTADSVSVKDKKSRERQSKEQNSVKELLIQNLPSSSQVDKTLQEAISEETATCTTAESKSTKEKNGRERRSRDQTPLEDQGVEELPQPCKEDKALGREILDRNSTPVEYPTSDVATTFYRDKNSLEEVEGEQNPLINAAISGGANIQLSREQTECEEPITSKDLLTLGEENTLRLAEFEKTSAFACSDSEQALLEGKKAAHFSERALEEERKMAIESSSSDQPRKSEDGKLQRTVLSNVLTTEDLEVKRKHRTSQETVNESDNSELAQSKQDGAKGDREKDNSTLVKHQKIVNPREQRKRKVGGQSGRGNWVVDDINVINEGKDFENGKIGPEQKAKSESIFDDTKEVDVLPITTYNREGSDEEESNACLRSRGRSNLRAATMQTRESEQTDNIFTQRKTEYAVQGGDKGLLEEREVDYLEHESNKADPLTGKFESTEEKTSPVKEKSGLESPSTAFVEKTVSTTVSVSPSITQDTSLAIRTSSNTSVNEDKKKSLPNKGSQDEKAVTKDICSENEKESKSRKSTFLSLEEKEADKENRKKERDLEIPRVEKDDKLQGLQDDKRPTSDVEDESTDTMGKTRRPSKDVKQKRLEENKKKHKNEKEDELLINRNTFVILGGQLPIVSQEVPETLPRLQKSEHIGEAEGIFERDATGFDGGDKVMTPSKKHDSELLSHNADNIDDRRVKLQKSGRVESIGLDKRENTRSKAVAPDRKVQEILSTKPIVESEKNLPADKDDDSLYVNKKTMITLGGNETVVSQDRDALGLLHSSFAPQNKEAERQDKRLQNNDAWVTEKASANAPHSASPPMNFNIKINQDSGNRAESSMKVYEPVQSGQFSEPRSARNESVAININFSGPGNVGIPQISSPAYPSFQKTSPTPSRKVKEKETNAKFSEGKLGNQGSYDIIHKSQNSTEVLEGKGSSAALAEAQTLPTREAPQNSLEDIKININFSSMSGSSQALHMGGEVLAKMSPKFSRSSSPQREVSGQFETKKSSPSLCDDEQNAKKSEGISININFLGSDGTTEGQQYPRVSSGLQDSFFGGKEVSSELVGKKSEFSTEGENIEQFNTAVLGLGGAMAVQKDHDSASVSIHFISENIFEQQSIERQELINRRQESLLQGEKLRHEIIHAFVGEGVIPATQSTISQATMQSDTSSDYFALQDKAVGGADQSDLEENEPDSGYLHLTEKTSKGGLFKRKGKGSLMHLSAEGSSDGSSREELDMKKGKMAELTSKTSKFVKKVAFAAKEQYKLIPRRKKKKEVEGRGNWVVDDLQVYDGSENTTEE